LGERTVCRVSYARIQRRSQMVSTGFPGDSDPRDEHPVCHVCAEDLSQDFWGDWFCAECDAKKSQQNEESA